MTASGHESGEGDRVTANSHGDLPSEQGKANSVDAAGHVESGLSETGIDPRIVTGLLESESKRNATGHAVTARGWTATETRPASDALDRLTASGKQSESENDGTGQESWPTESGLYDPSLFLDPKIRKHGRIENGSGPPKTLLTHHVAERAVMSGERQPRKRCGQGESAADEQLPPSQLPKEPRRQKHARAHRTSDQRHFHLSRWTEVEREERKPHGTQHKVHPETSPSLLAFLKGGKKKRKRPQGARLPKKSPQEEKLPPQWEARLKGVKNAFNLCKLVSLQKLPTAKVTNLHKSHKSCL